MVVDLFAIFPFCIAIAYVVYDEVYSPYSFYQIILILLMLLHLVLLQVIALYKKKYLFIFMMLSIISKVFVSVFGLYFWAIAIDSLLVVLLMMAIGFGSDAEIRKSEIPKFLLVRINNKFFINLVLIEIRYLCSRDQLFNIFALIVFGAFIFGAFFIHHRMEWSYFLIKSICIAILFLQLFVVGSMEFALKNLNMKMLDYWRGYGVSHRFIYCSQLLSVLFIGILSFIPLIVVVFLLSSLFSAFSLFWIVLAGIALISYLNMKSESVHFIVKVILVASVCFCAWDII
ncbi:hypothetical protein AC057_14730 [Acinetobacter genomosp. 33YU]|nr:hypothetical protein AC057_14730 [Acinetobacter genomosp. 33YU]